MTTTVHCPACGRPCAFDASNRWRPFCSERCKVVDLGAWASEQYRIAGSPTEDPLSGDDEPGTDPAR